MKYILSIFLFLFTSHSFAQRWENLYEEIYNAGSTITCAKKTYDDGYLFCRVSNRMQYQIIKTDINGQIIWSKRIFNEDYNYFYGIYIDITESGYIFISGSVRCGFDNYCSHVMCLNECGELVWSKYFDLDFYNYAVHIWGNDDGSAIVHTRYAGQHTGNGTIERVQLICFNTEGNVEWINHIVPFYDYDYLYNVDFENVEKSDHGFIFTGRCYILDSSTNLLYLKGLIVETDQLGNEIFVDYYHHNQVDSVNGELLYSKAYNDYYLTTGYEYLYDSAGSRRASEIIGKINKQDGEIIQHICNPLDNTIRTDYGIQLIECPLGLFQVKSIFKFGVQGGTLQFNKLDDNLMPIDSIIDYWNTSAKDQCALFIEEDSSFLFSGWHRGDSVNLYPMDAMAIKLKSDLTWDSLIIDTNVYDSLCPYPIDSGNVTYSAEPFIMVGMNEENRITKKDLFGLSIYPNPSQGELTFSTKVLSDNRHIEIYNISGILIEKLEFQWNINQILYNSSCLTPGVYVAKLIIEGQTSDVTKFIIQ